MASDTTSTDRIVATLAAVSALRGRGLTVARACAEVGVTVPTYYRWRAVFADLDEVQARRVGELLSENSRLTALLAERTFDVVMLTELLSHLQAGAGRRRAWVRHLMTAYGVSERRACALVGQHRSSNRYRPSGPPEDELVAAMLRQAAAHPGYGYRRVHRLLVEQGWSVTVGKVERLWRVHRVRPRTRSPPARAGGRQHGPGAETRDGAGGRREPSAPRGAWACEVVAARSATGPRRSALLVVDERTGEVLSVSVASSVSVDTVLAQLGRLLDGRPAPATFRVDRHHRWMTRAVRDLLAGRRVRPITHPSGSVPAAPPGAAVRALAIRRALADPGNRTTEDAAEAIRRILTGPDGPGPAQPLLGTGGPARTRRAGGATTT